MDYFKSLKLKSFFHIFTGCYCDVTKHNVVFYSNLDKFLIFRLLKILFYLHFLDIFGIYIKLCILYTYQENKSKTLRKGFFIIFWSKYPSVTVQNNKKVYILYFDLRFSWAIQNCVKISKPKFHGWTHNFYTLFEGRAGYSKL